MHLAKAFTVYRMSSDIVAYEDSSAKNTKHPSAKPSANAAPL